MPVIIPFLRRRRHRQRPAATPQTEPLVMTGVVSVGPVEEGLEVRITVDSTESDPVEAGGADPTKWTFCTGAAIFRGVSVSATTWNELSIVLSRVSDDYSPAYLAYVANPSDIATASGRALGAFDWEM